MNTEVYQFTDEQLLFIRSRWNNTYVERLINSLRDCSDTWKLKNIQLIPYFSQNCIFTCFSEKYGDVILKIGQDSLINEYNCLREFYGRNVCKVYEYDEKNEAILEQRIIPGTSLLNVKSQEERIGIFAALFKNLHVSPTNLDLYMPFSDKVKQKFEYIKTREDCKFLLESVNKSEQLFRDISVKYHDKKLLHGDLHHDNILLYSDGSFLIIDANGTIGDPVFEVSRFIMLEFDDDLTGGKDEEIKDLVSKLDKLLLIPAEILMQCLFIDNVLWLCSDLKSGETLAESQFIINNISVAANLIN